MIYSVDLSLLTIIYVVTCVLLKMEKWKKRQIHTQINDVIIMYCFMMKLMPCPFTGPKMICTCPNILSQTKNWIAYSATPKHLALQLKMILLNANHLLVWQKNLGTAQYLNKFWSYTIKFGPTQTILGPVEGKVNKVQIF